MAMPPQPPRARWASWLDSPDICTSRARRLEAAASRFLALALPRSGPAGPRASRCRAATRASSACS
eukprot:scaffold1452_cov117-Isochrysis_galbana.AAC.19